MECLNCGKETKNPKFCSRSCSSSYNNKGVRRHGNPPNKCLNCGGKTKNNACIYCSLKCQNDFQYKKYIENWKKGLENGIVAPCATSRHIQRYIREKYDNKCSVCGWCEVNPFSGKIPLELEHIDGNWKNNKEENLTLLCPNCHSLTPTYKALNKNGRKKKVKYMPL